MSGKLSKAQQRMLLEASTDGSEDFWLSMMLGLSAAHAKALREQVQMNADRGPKKRGTHADL